MQECNLVNAPRNYRDNRDRHYWEYRDRHYLLKSCLVLPSAPRVLLVQFPAHLPDEPIPSQWSRCHRVPSNRCRSERPPGDNSPIASHDTGGRVQQLG